MINDKMNVLFLRHYIEQSWNSTDKEHMEINNNVVIPFRSYCDSFWDLNGGEDENTISNVNNGGYVI